jgi:hypothetical protein
MRLFEVAYHQVLCERSKTADGSERPDVVPAASAEATNPPARTGDKVRKEPHPGSLWLEIHYAELPFASEWVAACKDGLVAHDPSLEAVSAKVAELGFMPNDVTVAFIEEP